MSYRQFLFSRILTEFEEAFFNMSYTEQYETLIILFEDYKQSSFYMDNDEAQEIGMINYLMYNKLILDLNKN